MSASARAPICPLGTPAGNARRQGRAVIAPAALAHAAVQPVLLHVGAQRRDVKDLVAQRLAHRRHRPTALAHRWRAAVVHTVNLGFGQQGPKTARVTLLRTALALTGAPLPQRPAVYPVLVGQGDSGEARLTRDRPPLRTWTSFVGGGA